ncbi:hypothetical protein AQJ91_46690 [Streptomyces dysideae]|uniref:Uncharacterized protein n=1 Tax=Streptomyces dysideae TaxID=909626 RepID=A0A101UPE9_9ACTN|nr:hypothetical protein AQJ91_46690 [Streptomyces dysideae]
MAEPRERVNSSLSGTARDVVQARDVQGGIHFHASAADRVRSPVPYQLPLAGQGFVDRCAEREALDRLLDGSPTSAQVLLITGTAGVGKTSLVLQNPNGPVLDVPAEAFSSFVAGVKAEEFGSV